MEMWIAIGVILNVLILLGIFLVHSTHKNATQKRQEMPLTQSVIESPKEIYNCHKVWLLNRWEDAHNQFDTGELRTFPKWFFSEASENQLCFLAEKGLDQVAGPLTKGQASDLIGLFLPVDKRDADYLNFCKVPMKELNRTTARAMVVRLLTESSNAMHDGTWYSLGLTELPQLLLDETMRQHGFSTSMPRNG